MSDAPTAARRRSPKKMEGETDGEASTKFKWERAFRAHGQPLPLLAIGLLLATYTNGMTGTSWPSVATLAKSGCTTRRTVTRNLTTLEAQGWIRRDLGGGTMSTTYHLTIPAVATTRAPLKKRRPMTEAEKDLRRRTRVKGDAGVEDDTPVKGDTTPLSRMTHTPVKDDTQSINKQSIDQSPLREPTSSRPPKGVTEEKWDAVRPILNEVARLLGADAPRFRADWDELGGKAALCQGIFTMLRNGNAHDVVELLSEDGYEGVEHPASALYARVKTYQGRKTKATSGFDTPTSAQVSGPASAVTDAIAQMTKSLCKNASIDSASDIAQRSGGRDAR